MSSPDIKITIKPGGKASIEVNNVQGQNCVSLSKGFEDLFVKQVNERSLKPEYYTDTEQHLNIEET